MSSQTTILAPFSQSARSPIHFPPLSSVQYPDVRTLNDVKRPSLLHALSAALQNIPVVLALSQSAEPHLQLPSSFADVPSEILQNKSGREQVLDVTSQTIPVPFPLPLLVQAVLPQMQGMVSSP